ncbi:MAG: 2-C-methyl-D-erythritol 2,4-cyclodiphosphate synthase [Actinomycetota bacterium]|nr:2-C-methyl-D-erythritol 2,4-cyclodiphosphate synthase [Actinomycetota bacterium]
MNRVGLGFDCHAFDSVRSLILGGVVIPGSPGLSGHSDADVLSHAIADALLGAGRLGDLGTMFPPDDRWREASSLDILSTTAMALRDNGCRIENVDGTVVAQSPKLAPHRAEMTSAIAQALGLPASEVSIKATTTDGLGYTGRGEGIAAIAVVLVDQT